ncbi:hypothetical protein RM844_07670 [Streptomyces sp. DSM 44915]|uniref:Transmembrane protein n=1 Tax=Streptomyces chisholmiae TaxID=3075540 RepID=A0ABU2JMF0_9ACTN|nr:hypothetical protein [Streptomyces sp. DSM 44915]MDT0266170.1 hypothetical protein [Streptomyces sp. DSM 44915]
MEAGPRETSGTTERAGEAAPSVPRPADGAAGHPPEPADDEHPLVPAPPDGEALRHADVLEPLTPLDALDPRDPLDALDPVADEAERVESYADLRPPRRLRLAVIAPIVVLSLLGSLMFAFPLAFAFDEAGAVVAMLGLLIGSSAAGWGMMAARRVGYTWPGVPPRGSGRRPDWRLLLLYAVALALALALAVWRVAGLR